MSTFWSSPEGKKKENSKFQLLAILTMLQELLQTLHESMGCKRPSLRAPKPTGKTGTSTKYFLALQRETLKSEQLINSQMTMVCLRVSRQSTEPIIEERILETRNTQVQIRRQANKQEIIARALKKSSVLQEPMSSIIGQILNSCKERRLFQPKTMGSYLSNREEFHCKGTAITKQDWQRAMRRLEGLHQKANGKSLFDDKKLTRFKQSSCLMKAVQKGDCASTNVEKRYDLIAQHLKESYYAPSSKYIPIRKDTSSLFEVEEIITTIAETNFQKAIGPEMFD